MQAELLSIVGRLAPQESSPEHVAKSVYSADQIEIKSQVTASFRIAGVKDSQDAE